MSTEIKHYVDKAYGVLPCCGTYFLGCLMGTIPVRPSLELMDDLAGLPRGSVVGIDACDPEEVAKLSSKVEGLPVSFSKDQLFYWKKFKQLSKNTS